MTGKTGRRGKIIFDMDGVIISEEGYWDTASLVVWELLYSKRYLGLEPEDGLPRFKTGVAPGEIAHIRKVVFQDDQVIAFIKNQGVNSNWDLAFFTFAYQLMLLWKTLRENNILGGVWLEGKKGVELEHLSDLSRLAASLPGPWRPSFGSIVGDWTKGARGTAALIQKLAGLLSGPCRVPAENSFKPSSSLWGGVQDLFQEWYLGEEKYRRSYRREPAVAGKSGLIFTEKPVLPAEKIRDTLGQLINQGWVLGIATGRSFSELYPPLEPMGIWEMFDPDSIVTFDDVHKAEQSLAAERQIISLGKPHPFSFLKAYWGKKFPDARLIFPEILPPPPGKCWIVGDAPADLLAAREAGAPFIGVLSGQSGVAGFLEREGARFVLTDMTAIPRCLAKAGRS